VTVVVWPQLTRFKHEPNEVLRHFNIEIIRERSDHLVQQAIARVSGA
jgi:hypothetical protein